MIGSKALKSRDLYLDKLIAFQDTEPVKIVTGIRRCGKSSLLKLMIQHLLQSGVSEKQIVEMNFESFAYKDFTANDLYQYVKERITPKKRVYLFFDELQRIEKWEDAINAFRVDFDCDIYITGSNAYLLSSEYATYLTGRYVEIKMLPLSFSEFIAFHDFSLISTPTLTGGKKQQVISSAGNKYDLEELFALYMRIGGFPGIAESRLDEERALVFLDSIYSTVVLRDILERENRRGGKLVSDPTLLRKVILFLADNVGSNISVSSIGNTLANEGLLESVALHRNATSALSETQTKISRAKTPSAHTVQSYVNALLESYLFYEIKRFDIKGKEFLRTLGKYYIADIGIRNYLLGFRNRDTGHALENVVYLELRRRGYDVSIGKVGNTEIDFIASKAGRKTYIQVTESMTSEDVRARELKPLKAVKDNYDKLVLSLHPSAHEDYEGIRSISVLDWLVECY